MWAGIAAMSVLVPFHADMKGRIKGRIPGNILGGLTFIVLYLVLPESMYSLIGILGGIGVGLSATYGWQAVFNSWGAMSIAMTFLGVGGAIFTVSLIMHLELSMHWFFISCFLSVWTGLQK